MATITRSSAVREAQWRRRNPDLAARLDRLTPAARSNILTVFAPGVSARGVSRLVRSADVVRRETRRDSDRRRNAERRAFAHMKRTIPHGVEFNTQRVKDRIRSMTDSEIEFTLNLDYQALAEAAAEPGNRNPWRYH